MNYKAESQANNAKAVQQRPTRAAGRCVPRPLERSIRGRYPHQICKPSVCAIAWSPRKGPAACCSIGISATSRAASATCNTWPASSASRRSASCVIPLVASCRAVPMRTWRSTIWSATWQTPVAPDNCPSCSKAGQKPWKLLPHLSTPSQFFSDLLIATPDFLDMVRLPLRDSPSRGELLTHLQNDVDAAYEDSAVLRAFRRFRQRHMVRIGTNDIIRDRPLEEVTRDISRVADTALEVALRTALRHIGNRFGEPYTANDQPARCVVLAFGKLGGKELNYSSDIDLMFLYDDEGHTRGKRVASTSNDDFYARVVGEVVRLLSAHTDRGMAYRVDLRLRPEGQRGALARSLASTLAYYDTLGRTWERQALIKVRPVAGDTRLGEEFIKAIEPFVYRKYLSFAEINEIKALKRRIEHKTGQAGASDTEVKTGHGGIHDVEFAIQVLQLLNGGDLPED